MPPKKGKKEKGGEKKGKKEPVEERPRILDWSNPSWKFAAKAEYRMGVVQRELIGKVNGSNVADVIDEYNKRLTDEYRSVKPPLVDFWAAKVSPSKAPTSDTLRSQPAASPGRGSPSRLDMRQLAAIFDGHGDDEDLDELTHTLGEHYRAVAYSVRGSKPPGLNTSQREWDEDAKYLMMNEAPVLAQLRMERSQREADQETFSKPAKKTPTKTMLPALKKGPALDGVSVAEVSFSTSVV